MVEMSNPMTGKSGKHHARNSTQLPDGWDKLHDDEGNKYYADNETGTTSWEPPSGSVGGSAGGEGGEGGEGGGAHARNETQLPDGWGKDFAGEEKYYFNEETGETLWDAPPGSVGGSAGYGVY
jgi:hypothetical protein